MATTPIYNWSIPDNTDLVKNGALAIRTLGDAIDTTMATMVPKSTFTAKGSIAAATAASTPANVTVGANDTLLAADSTAAAGVAWKASSTLYPWTSWTPTYQNMTIGNATVTAKYQQVGKLTNVFVKIVFGSTTTFTAYPIVIFPAGLTSVRGAYFTGIFNADDVSAGTSFTGTVYIEGGLDKFQGALINASSTYAYAAFMTGNTLPMTWTTGDTMTFSFTFEAA